MARLDSLLTSAVLGAGAMYFFDPQQGQRRQVLLEDGLYRLARETVESLDIAWRDLKNRARGTVAKPGVHAFSKWTPGTRLLASGIGVALMANCLIRRELTSTLLGTLGFGLTMCALSAGSCTASGRGQFSGENTSNRRMRGSGAPTGDGQRSQPDREQERTDDGAPLVTSPPAGPPGSHFPPAF